MPIRLVPLFLREQDVKPALDLIVEAQEWAPKGQAFTPPLAVLQAPNSHWMSALVGDELVGIVGFVGISWPDGSADVALGVVPKWRGKGIAKRVAKAQNDHAFLDLGLRRLQMSALANSPSAKIAQAVGLTLEGTLRGCRFKNGAYQDVAIYALVKKGG